LRVSVLLVAARARRRPTCSRRPPQQTTTARQTPNHTACDDDADATDSWAKTTDCRRPGSARPPSGNVLQLVPCGSGDAVQRLADGSQTGRSFVLRRTRAKASRAASVVRDQGRRQARASEARGLDGPAAEATGLRAGRPLGEGRGNGRSRICSRPDSRRSPSTGRVSGLRTSRGRRSSPRRRLRGRDGATLGATVVLYIGLVRRLRTLGLTALRLWEPWWSVAGEPQPCPPRLLLVWGASGPLATRASAWFAVVERRFRTTASTANLPERQVLRIPLRPLWQTRLSAWFAEFRVGIQPNVKRVCADSPARSGASTAVRHRAASLPGSRAFVCL
jgi:hypothetical protein